MHRQDNGYIYEQYRGKVLGFVRSKVLNASDAEDLVQNVFLKIYSKLDQYDETKASLSTWIYTITRNAVYDFLRVKQNHPTLELPENAVNFECNAPDAALLNRETLEELAGALEKLPQNQRDVIILLYYEKLDRKTVAEIFNLTYGQLRYLHDKAIGRLGELLHI